MDFDGYTSKLMNERKQRIEAELSVSIPDWYSALQDAQPFLSKGEDIAEEQRIVDEFISLRERTNQSIDKRESYAEEIRAIKQQYTHLQNLRVELNDIVEIEPPRNDSNEIAQILELLKNKETGKEEFNRRVREVEEGLFREKKKLEAGKAELSRGRHAYNKMILEHEEVRRKLFELEKKEHNDKVSLRERLAKMKEEKMASDAEYRRKLAAMEKTLADERLDLASFKQQFEISRNTMEQVAKYLDDVHIGAVPQDLAPQSGSAGRLILAAEDIVGKFQKNKELCIKTETKRNELKKQFDDYVTKIAADKSQNEVLAAEREQYQSERDERQREQDGELVWRKGLERENAALKEIVDAERARTRTVEAARSVLQERVETSRIAGQELVSALEKQQSRKRMYKYFAAGKVPLDAKGLERVGLEALKGDFSKTVASDVDVSFAFREFPPRTDSTKLGYVSALLLPCQSLAQLQTHLLHIIRGSAKEVSAIASSLPIIAARSQDTRIAEQLVRSNLSIWTKLKVEDKVAILFVIRKYSQWFKDLDYDEISNGLLDEFPVRVETILCLLNKEFRLPSKIARHKRFENIAHFLKGEPSLSDAVKWAEALTILRYPKIKASLGDIAVNGTLRKVVCEDGTFAWCEGDGKYVSLTCDTMVFDRDSDVFRVGNFGLGPIARVKEMIMSP